jgi:hypothetical protein
MKTIGLLLNAEYALREAKGRGDFPTNYGTGKNLDRIVDALKQFREEIDKEPMCWATEIRNERPTPRTKKNKDGAAEKIEEPTKDQIESGDDALRNALKEEVEFEPYKMKLSKICDNLKSLPMDEKNGVGKEQLQAIGAQFADALMAIDAVVDDTEE